MKLLLTLVLGAFCCYSAAADAYQAPSWACSPAPRFQNRLCPAPANGDSRCDRMSCPREAGCATEECNAVQGQIAAEKTLALDAWFQRGTACIKSTWTLSECCNLCKSTEGCNAWTYCNNADGCGADCAADTYDFKYKRGLGLWPLVQNVNPTDYPYRLNPEHKCLKGGKWPYNTCSLKVVAQGVDPKSPPLVVASEESGWVSGVVGIAAAPSSDANSSTENNTTAATPAEPVPVQSAVPQTTSPVITAPAAGSFAEKPVPTFDADQQHAGAKPVTQAAPQQDQTLVDKSVKKDAEHLYQPMDSQQIYQPMDASVAKQDATPQTETPAAQNHSGADVSTNNASSGVPPQQAASTLIPTTDGGAGSLETASSSLENRTDSSQIGGGQAQTTSTQDTTAAKPHNAAQSVCNSVGVVLAAAIGSMGLILSLA